MAVTASIYGNTFAGQYSATAARRIDWATDAITCSLHTSTYTPAQDTDDFWNDATNEISGTGYSTPGLALSGMAVSYDAGTNQTRLDAADASWTSASFTARIAVVYSNTAGAATTDPLVMWVNFGADETVASGTFTITWAATGLMYVAPA